MENLLTRLKALHPRWLLVLGILTLSAAHVSYSIDIMGWVSSVPFLLYLGRTKGARSRWWFLLALVTAWTITTAKIITAPIPFAMVFLFAIPISLIHLPAYLLWARLRTHRGAMWLFPALFTLLEWLQYTFSPFASWGVAAYTQSHSLTLLQSLSLLGVPGLSFLIYWVNVGLAEWLLEGKARVATVYAPGVVLVAVLVFGAIRLDVGNAQGKEKMLVAAVGTDSEVSGLPLPSAAATANYRQGLFARTRLAARAGARLVVWNEAAIFIRPAEEAAWQDSLAALARSTQVGLVAAYVVPRDTVHLRLENKYIYYSPQGVGSYSYLKHHPVPGEPSMQGQEALEVMSLDGITVGAAICYDYDYPAIAAGFQDLGADIVAVPSSDWRGIDPLHTRMAAYRAIEQGHSVLRSTRFGLSAAIDPHGQMVAQLSSFDQSNGVMLAQLPTAHRTTVYSLIGDLWIYCCMGLVLGVAFMIFRNSRKDAAST